MGEWEPVKCTKKLGATTYEEHRKLKSVHESVKQDNVQMADRVKQLQAENVALREVLDGFTMSPFDIDGYPSAKECAEHVQELSFNVLNATPQTARIQKVLEAAERHYELERQVIQPDNCAICQAIREYQQEP